MRDCHISDNFILLLVGRQARPALDHESLLGMVVGDVFLDERFRRAGSMVNKREKADMAARCIADLPSCSTFSSVHLNMYMLERRIRDSATFADGGDHGEIAMQIYRRTGTVLRSSSPIWWQILERSDYLVRLPQVSSHGGGRTCRLSAPSP